MTNQLFKDIEICFTHHGIQIKGFLNGDYSHWEFKSNDELFRTYFPSGILQPRITICESKMDFDDFLNSFYKEADKLIK
jgi:hypothetical protein